MKYVYFILIIASIVIISVYDKIEIQSTFDKKLIIKTTSATANIDSKLTTNSYQNGKVIFLTDHYTLTEQIINSEVDKLRLHNKLEASYTLSWMDSYSNEVTASAIGLDWKHHIVNSYLVGIRPFPVKNKWLPLYTIAKMKTYQLDSEQYQTVEMWQNSAQAFILPRGDCEDHAIILADWLISEGIDAKVVLGKYKTQGHAWVVATINKKSFLLEATSKRLLKSWNHYPLAKVAINYHPEYMFNRTNFWVNSKQNKNYNEDNWIKTSEFESSPRS